MDILPRVVSRLSTELPVFVTGPNVHSEAYWKRCCVEGQRWKNCQIAEHGLTWKQVRVVRRVDRGDGGGEERRARRQVWRGE